MNTSPTSAVSSTAVEANHGIAASASESCHKHQPGGIVARKVTDTETRPYDVVIVGGGAAGLCAALVLGRARRRVAVVDSGAPRNAPATHMHGYLSRDGLPPSELLAIGRAEVTAYGVELIDDIVVRIDAGFTIHLREGYALTARRVLVATGLRDDIPDLPGVRERWGKDFLHCPYCHGWEVRDRPLGVLGTNPASITHSQLVRQWSDDVVYFAHTQEPTPTEAAQLTARGIQIVSGEVTALVVEDDRLTGVQLADGRVVPRDAVFVRPLMKPHQDGLLIAVGCDLDDNGFPITDSTGLTNVPGLWVAGNAADPRAQVITAAGQGSAAAIAINNDLVQDDTPKVVDASR